MRILFVNPTLADDFSALDLAILTLATVVNTRSKHRASISDLTMHRRYWQRKLDLDIAREQPSLIAMSTNTMYMKYVLLVAAYVKSKHGLPVLVGGHHATRFPSETTAFPQIDFLLAGDAEETLPLFLDRLTEGASLSELPGCFHKDGSSVVLPNQRGRFYQNLDTLPYLDWDLWPELDRYFYFLGMLYMIGSRGCPYRCTFCDAVGLDQAAEGSYYRLGSPEKYAEEIAWQWNKYRHRGLRLAQLFDPVFTLKKSWVLAFAKAYIATGAHREFGYSVFSRIDNLDDERLEALAASGCKLLRVGIEAGDEQVRRQTYGKHIDNATIRHIMRRARAHGLGFTTFFILGGPSETHLTMRRTVSLAMEINPQRSAFFVYKPFTSEGIRQLKANGCTVRDKLWAEVDNISFGAVFDSPNFTVPEVLAFQRAAYMLTFGQRFLSLIHQHPMLYCFRLLSYFGRGLCAGLSPAYLAMYFHIYGYDHIDR